MNNMEIERATALIKSDQGAVGSNCALSAENNNILLEALECCINDQNKECKVDNDMAGGGRRGDERQLALLQLYLTAEGFKQLTNAFKNKVFQTDQLRRLFSYAVFAKKFLDETPLNIEIRVEGWKAYCLIPVQQTILRSRFNSSSPTTTTPANNCSASLLCWVHDEAWARARFLDPESPDFGLCGQFIGRSKFVTPCSRDSFPNTKEAALEALGLKGYAAFDKPGVLYVVRADISPIVDSGSNNNIDILGRASPKVPLLYNVGSNVDTDASEPNSWAPELHFQEGAFPGFTQGLKAELVINTFQLQHVKSIQDLNKAGVECVALGGDCRFCCVGW